MDIDLFDKKYKQNWQHYLIQCGLGGLAIYLGLFLINLQQNPVILASVGASTFIVFVTPENYSAHRRNILGGHLMGFIVGGLVNLIPHTSYSNFAVILYSLAVAAALLVMALTDTEHPPAAGTALGIAVQGASVRIFVSLAICVLVLSLFHHFFKKYLKNLL